MRNTPLEFTNVARGCDLGTAVDIRQYSETLFLY
jgi:hypothetical protein